MRRDDIRRNHTATHLLNWALREVLGGHIEQAGSLVEPGRLRFDFTHGKPLTDEETTRVETLVNERVLADEPVHVTELPLAQAKRIPGVRAVFGEKYPNPVRVVSVGVETTGLLGNADGTSASRQAGETPAKDMGKMPMGRMDETSMPLPPVEFCGGTHLERTSQVGLFKIVSEELVAKGVRRLVAVTGHEAVRHVQRLDEAMRAITQLLRANMEQVPERLAAMQAELKQLRKQREKGGAEGFTPSFELDTPAGRVVIGQSSVGSATALRNLCDQQRQKGAAAILVGGVEEGKVTLIAMVSDELAKAGKVKAGDWVKAAATVMGGSGGGKPTLAQAGGKDPDKLPDALAAGQAWIVEKLG